MFRKFHESELSQNNGFYVKSSKGAQIVLTFDDFFINVRHCVTVYTAYTDFNSTSSSVSFNYEIVVLSCQYHDMPKVEMSTS